MRQSSLAAALLIAGSSLFIPSVRAAVPAPVKATPVVAPEEKKADHEVTDEEYLKDLRETRRLLNEAKSSFDADKPDRDGRKETLEHIDKAIDAVDTEIKALEMKMKK